MEYSSDWLLLVAILIVLLSFIGGMSLLILKKAKFELSFQSPRGLRLKLKALPYSDQQELRP